MSEADILMDFKDGYSVRNKWIADIPLSKISNDFKDVSLHLAEYTIPGVAVASAYMQYRGISLEIPTNIIQPADRNITFSYMVDITWLNYFSLYQWSNLMSPSDNIMPKSPLILNDAMLTKAIKSIPINLYLISEYKEPILKVTYNNCWIKGFGELQMSYQDEPEVIKHSFTCAYSDFKLERITS